MVVTAARIPLTHMSPSFLKYKASYKGQLCMLVLPGLRWLGWFFNIEADLHLGC